MIFVCFEIRNKSLNRKKHLPQMRQVLAIIYFLLHDYVSCKAFDSWKYQLSRLCSTRLHGQHPFHYISKSVLSYCRFLMHTEDSLILCFSSQRCFAHISVNGVIVGAFRYPLQRYAQIVLPQHKPPGTGDFVRSGTGFRLPQDRFHPATGWISLWPLPNAAATNFALTQFPGRSWHRQPSGNRRYWRRPHSCPPCRIP